MSVSQHDDLHETILAGRFFGLARRPARDADAAAAARVGTAARIGARRRPGSIVSEILRTVT
jgi:hypothetical protein